MRILRAAWEEISGLFIDDGLVASLVIVTLVAAALLVRFVHQSGVAIAVLVVGIAGSTLIGVARRASNSL
jgi:hypothetical protein